MFLPLYLAKKDVKMRKNIILSSKRHAKHPSPGQKIQQLLYIFHKPLQGCTHSALKELFEKLKKILKFDNL